MNLILCILFGLRSHPNPGELLQPPFPYILPKPSISHPFRLFQESWNQNSGDLKIKFYSQIFKESKMAEEKRDQIE